MARGAVDLAATAHGHDPWPPLPYEASKDTLHAVHMWTQVVGKIVLALTPLVNHWWNSTLAVTPRGLRTPLLPSGFGAFQISFDFVDHQLVVVTSRGGRAVFPLVPMSVADFYRQVIAALAQVGVPDPQIALKPVEVEVAIPFTDDVDVRPYDRVTVERFQTALISTQLVFERFRADFLGKASSPQFFWGGFDLASARFSGRRSPPYTGGSAPNVNIHIMHEAYSHELIAAGFWPGNEGAPQPEYYSYAMPALAGLANATIEPAAASWIAARGEFILPYDAVRTAADPAAALLSFLQSTYDVSADLGGWDRALLEERVACDCVRLPLPSRAAARPRIVQ